MSGSPNQKIPQLTKAQWRNLVWFAENCISDRHEYYRLLDKVINSRDKIDRLYEEAKRIKKYCNDNGITGIDDMFEGHTPAKEAE